MKYAGGLNDALEYARVQARGLSATHYVCTGPGGWWVDSMPANTQYGYYEVLPTGETRAYNF